MADMSTPLKNTAFTLSFTLYKNDGTVIANPGTITKKVSTDGAAVADVSASVTEEDTTYGQLSLVLSAGEMNGDFIWVYVKDDTAGCVPFTCSLYPAAGNAYAEAALVHAHAATIEADTTELQENQGDWLTATGFSTFDPANDDVAVVNLVDVCTLNSDMVDVSGLSTFDPANDPVASVTLVDTTTVNTDMVAAAPDAATVATAVRNELATELAAIAGLTGVDLSEDLKLALKLLRNKTVTDTETGYIIVYDDDGTTVLYTAKIYESADTTTPYAGGAINRKDRLA